MGCKIIAITDSRICTEPLSARIEKLARAKVNAKVKAGVDAIILREKWLTPADYRTLAKEALGILAGSGVRCILHGFPEIARELGAGHYHCQSTEIAYLSEYRAEFETLGVSVHSLAEYRAAQGLADYAMAGHIFPSNCKLGVEPNGVELLREILADMGEARDMDSRVCELFAVGGITLENLGELGQFLDSACLDSRDSGALHGVGLGGVCLREPLMRCDDPALYVQALRAQLDQANR